MGYPLFGTAHLISVAVVLSAVLLICFWFRKITSEKQSKVLKAVPIVMVALELSKDLLLILNHRFGFGYLPLHLCSIGIFVFLFREYLPWKRAKDFFGEVAFILIMPASVAALLDADWTYLYPVWNFINLHSYVWHGLLVLYPLLLKRKGETQPSIRHFHWVLLFLAVAVIPIFVFDKRFQCNYFFVNWPIPNSPLAVLAKYMGNPGYLVGYALLVVGTILLMYLLLWILNFLRRVFGYGDEKRRENQCNESA
ncbi:MAG: YwaF family protein [Lachnospiraceae bacterium]|nr:YwaF family protein [Lachnospiraceae bacterium]